MLGVAANAAASLGAGCGCAHWADVPCLAGRGGRLPRRFSSSRLRVGSRAPSCEAVVGESRAWETPATDISGRGLLLCTTISGTCALRGTDEDAERLLTGMPAEDDRPLCLSILNGRNGFGGAGSSGGGKAVALQVGQDCRSRSHSREQSPWSLLQHTAHSH